MKALVLVADAQGLTVEKIDMVVVMKEVGLALTREKGLVAATAHPEPADQVSSHVSHLGARSGQASSAVRISIQEI